MKCIPTHQRQQTPWNCVKDLNDPLNLPHWKVNLGGGREKTGAGLLSETGFAALVQSWGQGERPLNMGGANGFPRTSMPSWCHVVPYPLSPQKVLRETCRPRSGGGIWGKIRKEVDATFAPHQDKEKEASLKHRAKKCEFGGAKEPQPGTAMSPEAFPRKWN